MTLVRIVTKSLRHHLLSTVVTAGSIALATGLWITVWVTQEQAERTFSSVSPGFDAVLGARGSQLQLVLNAVFHLEASPGNVSAKDYEDIKKDERVQLAVPIAVGDNYLGSRLVGTTLEMFEKAETQMGRRLRPQPGGRLFDPLRREALAGSYAAAKLGLKVGDTFKPYHGLIFNPNDQHAEVYVVVGILEPSNTPADRVIWIPLAGLQSMAGHDPKTATDVSAVLVKLKSPIMGRSLDQLYNRQGNRLTFAWPIGTIVVQLFDKVAWFQKVLELVSYMVALVAAGSVLASIYNSMNERRREIAILRSLGARKASVFSIIILESSTIAGVGAITGLGAYLVLMSVVASIVRAQTGVVLNPFVGSTVLLVAPLCMVFLGAMAGIIPAFKAYRTDVASNLSPGS